MTPAPSIKHNVIANYASQIYVMGVRFVMAPVYLAYLGTEAYGLIGFFMMMSVWFQLLDVGLTPTLARETARFRGGAVTVDTLRAMIRALEVIFGAVSLGGVLVIVFSAHFLATHWLKVGRLPVGEVTIAVLLMGIAVPIRWVAGLYRGVITGFERQVWNSVYGIVITTFSVVGVLVMFRVAGASPVNFFAFQLAFALVDLTCVATMTYRLARRGEGPRLPLSLRPLIANLSFSLVIAFTATAWIAITQTDKLILSKVLSLGAYGVFSIAVLGANAINTLVGPFGTALLPRLTKLVAERNEAEVARLYGRSTQLVCVLVGSVAAVLCFFSEPVLYAWTGKIDLARQAAPILSFYVIGNCAVALYSFPYYMQYARGRMRLHFIGNSLLLTAYVASVLYVAPRWGGYGTGAVWALVNVAYVALWIPLVHRHVLPAGHWRWMLRDVLSVLAPAFAVGFLVSRFVPVPRDRWAVAAFLISVGIVLLLVAGLSSSEVRRRVRGVLAIDSGRRCART